MRSILIILILTALGGTFLYYYNNNKVDEIQKVSETLPSPILKNDNVDIKASFKIITNGTTRIFTDSRYHNLSDDVYITSKDPNKVEVRKENITWSDFFKTLPMSLDKNCLVTGTKQTFCTGNGKYLRFLINGIENQNALDQTIKNGDSLRVTFE